MLQTIAEALEVDIYWLVTGKHNNDAPTTAEVDDDTSYRYHYVPYYKEIVASAGGGRFSDGVIGTDDFLAFRKDWIDSSRLTATNLVAITLNGDSMMPTIPEQATVLVDKSKTQVKDGRIYVVRIDEKLYVKRTQWLVNGGLRLISDNKELYDPMDITKEDMKALDIEIYGQVVHISYGLPH